ncbi:zwei Ig domain protein zig-8-like isoform X3 [Biomphalaria glabrata]|uniref:Zwei Ig domain protein zig-8-like isoform X3 n=1 Tax=Biomphalaria glabrata TaxID=6526 RepID=A0A9W3AIX8_BIOGL|nr:zwei Ig domain protein zig-8-like isoform X3 [Biomphalaria glabrata]
MKRQRREPRWIDPTINVFSLLVALAAFLTTMALAAPSVHDDILGEHVPVPEFLPGTSNVTVREGDAAMLPCSVKNLGTKQVVWRRVEGDKVLTIGTMTWSMDNNVSMEHSKKSKDVTTWNLILHHVTPEDSGVYECQLTSRAGHVRHVTLNVVGPPLTSKTGSSHLPEHLPSGQSYNIANLTVSVCGAEGAHGCSISITGRRYVDQGEKIFLRCNASGGARVPDEMDWFKGGDKIDENKYKHVQIYKIQSHAEKYFVSELTIEHSSLADTGDYICRSSTDDIANLKVTVLHAESANKRRGTNQGDNGTHKSMSSLENGASMTEASKISFLLTLLLALLWTHTQDRRTD